MSKQDNDILFSLFFAEQNRPHFSTTETDYSLWGTVREDSTYLYVTINGETRKYLK